MNLEQAAEGPPFDAVIIGGGINGAGIARELALHGLRIALLEASDFGFGTTWRSTRLIHGGLRYLEHGELGLVRESLRERGRLLRERPHLVKPQPFVVPQLPWSRRPQWQFRVGLALYDLLARGGGLPRHGSVSPQELLARAPGMGGLAESGGLSFFDARAVSPERVALELALEARDAGALVLNHARVTAIEVRRELVAGVQVEADGRTVSLAAPHVINAAGPWVDAVNGAAGVEGPRILGVTRGSHVAFELGESVTNAAVLATAKSDGRVFFALPHSGLLLVGTTDVRHGCGPDSVRPEASELTYLLEEAQNLFPRAGLTADHVRYVYSGLRPLLASPGKPEGAITRRHAVIDHGSRGGPAGLYSVAGGKLSTYRPLAMQVLRAIGIRPRALGWHERRFPQGSGKRNAIGPQAEHLERYGAAAAAIARIGSATLCPHAGAVTGEVEHGVRNELATTVADVLMRRSGIAWHACRGLCCHRTVAALMAPLLGWDDARTEREALIYESELATHLPAWADVVGGAS